MYKRSVLLLVIIICGFESFAQEVPKNPVTLSKAIEMALEKNYSINIARNNAEVDENNAFIGNAGLLPSLEASGGFSTINESFEAGGAILNIDTTGVQSDVLTAAVNANYVLFDGFGNIYRFRSLQNLKEQSGVQARLQIESTLIAVISEYLNVIANDDAVQISRAAIERSESRLARVTKRYDLGAATRLDVLNAQVDLNTDSVSLIQSETALENAKRSLNINLGLDPETAIQISDEITLSTSLTIDDLLPQAMASNASLVLSKLAYDNAELGLKTQKSGRFPIVSLNGSYNYNNVEGGAGIFNTTTTSQLTGGISIRLNLFNGRQQEIRIQNAQIAMKNSNEQYELAQISLKRDVFNGFDSYRTSLFLLEKEAVNLETAQLNFQRASDLFDLGQITSTDFREAQLNVTRVEQRIVNLKIQAKLAEVQLYQLAGRLISN